MRAGAQWELWSTTAQLVVDRAAALADAVGIAKEELDAVDAAVSRFRADSELNLLEAQLPHGVEVSERLAMHVARGLEAARRTDGLVDPTVRGAMDALGYDRDIRLVLDDDRPVRAVLAPRPGWSQVRLEGRWLSVPAHLGLDLGATAKAVAADAVAATVARELGCGVLVSLGGDVATAGPEPADGWTVLVEDAPGEPSTLVRLASGSGLATSSTIRRTWRRGEAPMHHIVDPRTGMPAEQVWRTVSVAAEDCFTANTLSTAAVVRGASAADWLASRSAARLVALDGHVVTVGGWPAERAAA